MLSKDYKVRNFSYKTAVKSAMKLHQIHQSRFFGWMLLICSLFLLTSHLFAPHSDPSGFYATLNVAQDATQQQIKKARDEKVRLCHSDKEKDPKKKLKKMNKPKS